MAREPWRVSNFQLGQNPPANAPRRSAPPVLDQVAQAANPTPARAPTPTPAPAMSNFDATQMAAESGGRQFDAQGRPLVGRYRDGSTPAPGKEAYGAGQMQIGTARDAARRAGITWNQERFMNDRDYNLSLADAHMGHLIARYGDRTLARAAYHSGEGTVDRAIARYGRDGFAQGLGPEGRRYIQMGSQSNRAGASGGSTPLPSAQDFLSQMESVVGPEARASGNVRQNSNAIFNSDSELNVRADRVEQNLNQQGTQIDILDQAMEVAQAGAREALTQQLADTREISSQITQGTQELKRQVTPVFQARGRIADQLDHLNTMNPLERGIRGIFDLNYDQDYLEGQLDNYDRTLQARAADFDYLNNLHSVAMQEIDRRYSMDTAIPALMQAQATEDLGLTGMRIQQTASMLDSLKGKISTESQLIAAKAQARGDLLTQLDLPTIADLMTQAEAAGGMVAFNGVEFSYSELRQGAQARESQDLSIRSARNAIASQDAELAEQHVTNLARSLSRSQIEAAVANGGVHEGISIPQDLLTNLQNSAIARDQQRAEAAANNLPAATGLRVAADYMNISAGLQQRASGLMGRQSVAAAIPLLEQGSALTRRLIEASRNNEPPEVISALTQQIAANSAQHQTIIDAAVLQHAGGDTRAAGYLRGFMTGQPLSEGTSIEALAYFANKGSLPEGLTLSPQMQQAFAVVQHVTRAVQQGGTIRRAGGPAETLEPVRGEAEQLRRIQELAGPQIRLVMGQARHDQVYNNLPDYARSTRSPIGALPSESWTRIRNEAASFAAGAVAREAQTTPQAWLEAVGAGRLADMMPGNDVSVARYNALEQEETVRLLDLEPAIQPGRRNSSLYLDFLGSPQLNEAVRINEESNGSNHIGEYLLNPIARGAAMENLQRTGENLANAQEAVYQRERQIARSPEASTLFTPRARAQTILAAIPSIGSQGAQRLAPFIDQFLSANIGTQGTAVSPNERFRTQDAAILAAMQATSFEDPVTEQYRKSAVQHWNQYATENLSWLERTYETMRSIVDLSGETMPSDSLPE